MRFSSSTLEALHRRSSRNREAVESAQTCGCFYCKRIFESRAIVDWVPEVETEREVTALCPFCGIDSVISAAPGKALTPGILDAMHSYWFERTVELSVHPSFAHRIRIRLEPLIRRVTWDLWQSRKAAG